MSLRGSRERMAMFRPEELRELLELGVGLAVTGVLPQGLDDGCIQKAWALARRVRRGRIDRVASRMERVLGTFNKRLDFAALAAAYGEMCLEERWGQWRTLQRGGWRPETGVDGLEEIWKGLERRRGVILWGLAFCGNLIPKVALSQAGVRVSHLSATGHGAELPLTRLGRDCLAPALQQAENRYLHDRIVIDPDGPFDYIDKLNRALAENGCVWISGERDNAIRLITAPVLGGQLGFPPGAPSLAWEHDATLLTVRAIREARFRYRLIVDPPINVDRSLGRAGFIESAVRCFAGRITRSVLENPADWEWGSSRVRRLMQ